MENAYSLRKAAEQAGVPTMTFHRYKERGVIEPDVEDKKGNLTLYSEEQVRRAKDYYEQSGRSRKKSVKGEDEVVSQEKSEIVTLEARADKIRQLQGDVQRGIIEIGRELNEAKKEVPHGQWGAWLAREFEWTDRTARNFMAVAERYGNRKTFSDLKPSTLQAMLSLPAGEEEAFIAEQEAAGKLKVSPPPKLVASSSGGNLCPSPTIMTTLLLCGKTVKFPVVRPLNCSAFPTSLLSAGHETTQTNNLAV